MGIYDEFPSFSSYQYRLWNAWSILHSSRQLAFDGYQHLRMTDIEVVGRIYNMDLEDFINIIISLDVVFIGWCRSKEE